MTALTFSCSAVVPFDLFALPAWLESELRAGRSRGEPPHSVEVRHPEREMDGSCRWCGCREDETVRIGADGAIER